MKSMVLFLGAVWEAVRDRGWVDVAAQPWMAFPGSLTCRAVPNPFKLKPYLTLCRAIRHAENQGGRT
jgi:hypothetical protein